MRRNDNDLLRVPDTELDRLDGDELLRLVVITRDGDRKATGKAKAAWKALVAKDIDRVRGIVSAFRHKENPGIRVDPDDVDQVAQDSYIRMLGMAFRGTSEGEYRSAMSTCVRFECMDHCRRKMEEDKRRGGSLDDGIKSREGDTRPRFEKEIAERERQRIADEESLARLADRRERLDEAISKIEDERKRKVLEMTRERCTTEEIMAALDTSEANVYQLRRRALKLVEEIFRGDGQA